MRHTIHFALVFTLALVVSFGCSRTEENPASGDHAETTATTTNPPIDTAAPSDTASATMAAAGGISSLTNDDKTFVMKVAQAGMAEVRMGTMGAADATNADVKAFANRILADHGKANEELKQLASTKGLSLPTELDGDQKSGLDHLDGLDGAAFDRAYMDHMVSDHQTAVADFEKASTGAGDADLRAWAAKTLPTLREHLQLAIATRAKLK